MHSAWSIAWFLAPIAAVAAVSATAVLGRNRLRRGRSRWSPWAALPIAVVLGAYPGLRLFRGYEAILAAQPNACRALGHCGARVATWKRIAEGRYFELFARDDADCVASRVCPMVGWCTAVRGECKATSDDRCRASDVCANHGWCVANDGRCAPSTSPE